MNEKVFEKISVVSSYNHEKNRFIPYKIRWRLRDYFIKKIAYHHKIREGRNLIHIFHVTDGNLDFRIRLDAENLNWTLEEVSDGSSD
ncbi:hypothetical protein COS50_02780 [Candidatus Roizmanbacteria bacterium CG03_land_8_20_14_0_80_35_26]|uniref:Uncharacterized protein n=3 Tax=Candidatus Roizmaniibacteriota TaxID=1752723 RepID=A0A2M7BWM8_9BACT|nr:MAG: hypothetical protein COV86_02050 [Candidatus Roizmanbacteria bacterium CG11_big_fil_rev_8_21_14_0_20_35_14]PIV10951.1 MAG: hypothetical protein COS50_02780 [Candidatus Roizmanbacteria bacterium CG03_land_8_20_14_0_80_35_26]PJC32445.1 MAG: hypothetical protein CO049_03035 [Candidatus Roizmanbacteria bacterium CG_4_9_14_0_2_um_filter_36_12]PJC80653.1 MAG: hypothetical protein CO008_01290 [Candidatus Roizmanbacteria bacterium CG_4_8_14_3_um_filter_36_12]